MKFDKLTTPSTPFKIEILNILIHINFSKTFTWASLDHNDTEKTTYVLTFSTIDKIINDKIYTGYNIIIGPIKILFGFK